jgi:hypothetical protein
MRPETSASGSSVSEEIVCFGASGSAKRGGKAHALDAEARIDRFDLVAQEPCQPLYLAHRQGRADADGLDAVADAMKQKVETPRAKSFGLEGLTELGDELGRVPCDCLRRADRLREDTADLNEIRRANRINRFTEASHGLIEAAAEFGTEAQDKRRAGFCREFADALKIEDGQVLHHGFGQAQGGDGQVEDGRRTFSRRNDDGGPDAIAGKGMGGAPAIGERGPRGDARCGELVDHPLQHGVFPAMKMGGAGCVDHQPVRRIGRDDRRVAPQRPEREPVEGSRVGRRVRVLDDQARHNSLRRGRRHANAQACPLRCRIRGQHHAPPSLTADQDERRLSR